MNITEHYTALMTNLSNKKQRLAAAFQRRKNLMQKTKLGIEDMMLNAAKKALVEHEAEKAKKVPSAVELTVLADEHKDILKECRNKAMDWTVCGRNPERGMFSQIAQDLDYLCEQLGLDND